MSEGTNQNTVMTEHTPPSTDIAEDTPNTTEMSEGTNQNTVMIEDTTQSTVMTDSTPYHTEMTEGTPYDAEMTSQNMETHQTTDSDQLAYQNTEVADNVIQTQNIQPCECAEEDPRRADCNVESLLQENQELRVENMKLKEHILFLNTHLQRLNVSLLNDSQVYTNTGISRKLFDCIDHWLQPVSSKQRVNETLSPSQKLLLVFMRLRHNHTQSDLACRFNVEQSSVSRILNHWIPFLSAQFKRLIRWPQTCVGPSVAPYDLLPNSVAIIDGTEIFIQRPSNLATQKSSFSDYKSHTTVKYLVAIDTFTGVFIFVSAGFSGNSSDRFTIEHSGILEELKPGQRILADKGYNARDLFAQKRCFLTIPSFLSGDTFTAQEARQSRSIASVRIRVENAIRRIKEFKICRETLCNRTNKKIVDDMIVIVCALCNLKEKLIK